MGAEITLAPFFQGRLPANPDLLNIAGTLRMHQGEDQPHGDGGNKGAETLPQVVEQRPAEHKLFGDWRPDRCQREHQHDHQRNHQGTLTNAPQPGRESGFHPVAELCAILRFVDISLNRANLMQRLVDIGTEIGDAILACTRQAPHTSTEQRDRPDHQRDDINCTSLFQPRFFL